ncbi:MAG: HNH endonuclease [Acidobacteria bacterium]|nr:HNH endonuclease [Acidobacteriota bacterium]MCL5286439.1 HNH endonuclease [Acidobacteriota bacterium]
MRPRKNAGQIWKEFEDYLAPLLGMKPGERAVYNYLVRHSRLEGRRGVVVGVPAIGRGAGLSYQTARLTLLRLQRKGCVTLRPYRREYAIQVLLPEEVMRELRPRDFASITLRVRRVSKNKLLRQAILERERWRCFYCRRRLKTGHVWLDHLVALARGGFADEGNIVACCQPCNQRKSVLRPETFLRHLRDERRITKAHYRKQLATVRRILDGNTGLRKAA